MEMTQKERREFIKDVALAVIRMLNEKKKINKEEEEWVSMKNAAQILGISLSRMKHIKDRFPHVKQGDCEQGRVLFLKSALMENYING